MATVKQVVGAKVAVAASGLSTLASAAYVTSSTVNNTTNQPVDLLVELTVTPGTVSANKQALLFGLASLDGTNFQTGANANDELGMTFLGSLPLNSNATSQTKPFSVAAAYGGVLPPYNRFVVKNESGAAFSTASLSVAEISVTVA